MKYYYVGTMLPALSFDTAPEIKFHDFDQLLKDNLTSLDYQKTVVMRRLYDILNIKAFWKGDELSPYGTLDENEIGEGLLNQVTFPDYVYAFLVKHESVEDQLKHFPELLAEFFRKELKNRNGILHQYLEFEREWRLVFTAFRAKKLGRDLSVEFQYEDPEEDLIAQMLAQKDSKDFEPPEKYQELKVIFDKYRDDPLALQKALDEYRYNYITGLVDMADSFSLDRILVYMARLLIVEKWASLDNEKGLEIVSKLKIKG